MVRGGEEIGSFRIMVFFSDGTELNKFLGRGEGLGDEEFCQDSIGNV